MKAQRFEVFEQATAYTVGDGFRLARCARRIQNPDWIVEWNWLKD